MARSKKSAHGSKAAKAAKRVVATKTTDVIASEIGCMLEHHDCPIKSRGDACDGTTKVHACSNSNCKRGKTMYTCNEMQKLMLGSDRYKLMKTCIVHRMATLKSKREPERAKRHRDNMRENVAPRNNLLNNKKPGRKNAVRASERRKKIRELDWVERKQSHAEELVQPQKVKELQTFVDNHRKRQLHSLFNAELSHVVAVDSAVTTRGGGDKGENLYGVAAYSGDSETWMGLGRCGAQNEGKWNVRQWEKGGYDLRGPEHNDNMVLDKCVPEKDAKSSSTL